VKVGVRYQTTYIYDEPVSLSVHEVRLFPRGDHFTRVRALDFRTNTNANVRFGRDVFDNNIASCTFADRVTKLQFQLKLDLEVREKDPFHFLVAPDAVDLPIRYDRHMFSVLKPYRTRRTSGVLDIPCWQVPTTENPRPTVTALVELNQCIHECVGYERREDGPARAPDETLRVGKGACRDVALLLAEILRSCGLAARLASGYLREGESETRHAEGSLHAWTEAFLPGAGWIALDPTHGIFGNHNFICAAVGITPGDVTPISGTFYHKGEVSTAMTSRLELVNL